MRESVRTTVLAGALCLGMSLVGASSAAAPKSHHTHRAKPGPAVGVDPASEQTVVGAEPAADEAAAKREREPDQTNVGTEPATDQPAAGPEDVSTQTDVGAEPATDEAAVSPERVSEAVTRFGSWVIASGDNQGLPFAIVDKVQAEVLVFDPDGQLRGAAPALMGMARGDDSVPGIGERKLSTIRPEERTTPAGRFIAGFGQVRGEETILWVDYEDAISIHPVITANRKEHRLRPEDADAGGQPHHLRLHQCPGRLL